MKNKTYLNRKQLRGMINEEVANLAGKGKSAPFGSGMEKAKGAPDIVSHSCASHVQIKSLSEASRLGLYTDVGVVKSHSLREDGTINYYTAQFGDTIVEDIHISDLKILEERMHSHEAKGEPKVPEGWSKL